MNIIIMVEFRIHGNSPYHIAVLHGGPGAWGEMQPIADFLSDKYNVIEPFFLSPTLNGQLEELDLILKIHDITKITLIGFSWGAWIAYLFAARYPERVKKVILVGSGPYEHRYYLELTKTRESRMTQEQKLQYKEIFKKLQDPDETDKDSLITQLGTLCKKTDQYREAPHKKGKREARIHFDLDRSLHFHHALNEAIEMRKSGQLRDEGKKIICPVVAIHGVYDPHPAEGVKLPLEKIIIDFRFIAIEKCGHKPWTELHAKTVFYDLLTQNLDSK